MVLFTTFVNCRLCINGELIEGKQLVSSEETGNFLRRTGYIGGEIVDVEDNIIAPGFLELQTNGMLGFHFTHFEDQKQYEGELGRVAKGMVERGVTGFWATVPTVEGELYRKILPSLQPRTFENSASLLGAHVEGPYLNASKKGAHNADLFQIPEIISAASLYGKDNLSTSVKLVTIAPEVPKSSDLIKELKAQDIRISLGHSNASYDTGLQAVKNGATALTHVFNAMAPMQHREPGLAGLISSSVAPYYSLIADNVHLHPNVLSMSYRANPQRAILITDSIELAGLPDGTYPGHAQVAQSQEKKGNRVVIEGTDTLIGSCCGLDECVRNLVQASGCSIAEAVRCVTENVADMMGLRDRGRLVEGMRADFVVLNDDCEVLETWIGGRKVWQR